MRPVRPLLALLAATVAVLVLAGPAWATTFSVNDVADPGDGTCDASCTLRDAILAANANSGADTISFSFAGTVTMTITPAAALPTISDAVTIDGTTHAGPSATVKGIELDGSVAGGNGLTVSSVATGSLIKGLAITAWSNAAIQISSAGVSVQGNYVGTNPAGNAADPNGAGVNINSSTATVGGPSAADRNVISGNTSVAINAGGNNHLIQNNYIGTDRTGLVDLGNGNIFAVGLGSGSGTTIADNLIAGNSGDGIQLQGTSTTTVIGNTVGLGSDGDTIIPNDQAGVNVLGASNVIGGDTAAERNVISGNGGPGVSVSGATGNSVLGNYIGTDAAGAADRGNTTFGVSIGTGTGGTVVGGANAGEGNLLSGNSAGIVVLNDTGSTTIQGNYVGVDATGASAVGNTFEGINTSGSGGTVLIGGTATGAGNLVSGNLVSGIVVGGAGTVATIQGNYVGTGAGGASAIPNGGPGLDLAGSGTVVGGLAAGAANVIANNGAQGILLNPPGTGVRISGNAIHGNTGIGIDLANDGVTANDAGDADGGANNLQNFPVLSAGVSQGGASTVSGTLDSEPSTTYTIEVFRNAACDGSGNGEGVAFVGSGTATTDGAGHVAFMVSGSALPPGETILTATATPTTNSTSEFSQCFTATILPPAGDPPPAEGSPPPGGSPGESPPPEDKPVPPPVAEKTGNVEPISGTVLVRLPRTARYIRIDEIESLPVGTIVDVRKGTARLKVSNGVGGFDLGTFSGGIFRFTQRFATVGGKRILITDIRLVRGNFAPCRFKITNPRAFQFADAARRRVIRYLNARASGNFNVIGKNASGLERGTTWKTIDTCTTTEVRVRVGVVAVSDFAEKRTINVRAGKTYIADAKPRRPR